MCLLPLSHRPKREYNHHQAVALATAQAAANASNNNNNSANNANSNTASTHHHPYLIGDDPYMIDSVAEGLLPLLSLETSRQTSGPSSQLSIVSIRGDNNRMLSLPSLSVEQNHSAILSELVKALWAPHRTSAKTEITALHVSQTQSICLCFHS